MAVTAKFQADFESFYAAVNKAEVELRGLESGAGKVEKSLNKMADSFSGRKIIQDANLAAEAVQKIGGASKLTAAEQERLNRTLTEALAKYKALGIEAPSHLRVLEHITRQVNTEIAKTPTEIAKVPSGLGTVVSSLKSVAGAMGVAFSVGAVTSWVSSTLQAASRIDDLSTKLGVSTEAVQRWEYAARQSGATMETVDKAVSFMNKTLGQGNDSTVEALTAAGLKFDEIRAMKPEDAFNAIAKSIAGIEDPMTRARVATELFGRGGQDLLPALVNGFDAAKNAANVMADDTVKRLAAAEDAWDELGMKATIVSGEIIAAVIKAFSQPPGEDKYLQKWLDAFNLDTTQAKQDFADLGKWLDVLSGKIEGMPKIAAPKIAIGAPIDKIRLSPDDVRALEAELNAEREALDKASRAASQHELAIRKMVAAYTGAEKIKAANDAVEAVTRAVRQGTPIMQMSADTQAEINKVVGDGIDVYRRQGKVAPESMRLVWLATTNAASAVKSLAIDFKTLGTQVNVATLELNQLKTDIPKVMQGLEGLSRLPGLSVDVSDLLPDLQKDVIRKSRELSAALKRMGQEAAAAFAEGFGSLKEWASQFVEDFIGELLGMIPVIGGFLKEFSKPIVDWAKEFFGNLFDRNKGRDIVKSFAESFGGFDALHAQLAKLGAEGERLWIQLTQGVGRNNPKQAQAAIDAITAAFARQEEVVGRLAEEFGGLLSDLADKATGAGRVLDASLRPFIEQAREAGVITDDLAARLLGMTESNAMGWREMQSLAEKYGIEISGLGQNFQQQKMTETAGDIIRDFNALVNNGADFNTVLKGMTDEINTVVRESIKFGTEIPGNMRPWIEALIKSGELVDENGEKITDINTLKFGPELKDDVDLLVEAIQKLIQEIRDGLGGAIKDVDGREFTVRGRWRMDPAPTPEADTNEFIGVKPIPQAHGGDWWVTKPTLFMAGEAGPERATFTPAGKMVSSGQEIVIHNYLTLDGAVVTESVARRVLG